MLLLKRSLNIVIALKNTEFDKEALIEREKSFEEMTVCKSYYTYNKIFEKAILGFGDTKRYSNTKKRLVIESSVHQFGLASKNSYNASKKDQTFLQNLEIFLIRIL